MLEGWFCRTMNSQSSQQDEGTDTNADGNDDSGSESVGSQTAREDEPTSSQQVDYKSQYRFLRKKLRYLIYENEFFQDALRSNQRRLLKVSRDRAFLLDRLLHYEKPDKTSSESDETESSEEDVAKEAKKAKQEGQQSTNGPSTSANASTTPVVSRGRKKKNPTTTESNLDMSATTSNPTTTVAEKNIENTLPTTTAIELEEQQQQQQQHQEQQQKQQQQQQQQEEEEEDDDQIHQMTAAEVERHLQSKQTAIELIPERASATVPAEMFSNEPSLHSESVGDQIVDSLSPTHVAAEECVPMEYAMECDISK